MAKKKKNNEKGDDRKRKMMMNRKKNKKEKIERKRQHPRARSLFLGQHPDPSLHFLCQALPSSQSGWSRGVEFALPLWKCRRLEPSPNQPGPAKHLMTLWEEVRKRDTWSKKKHCDVPSWRMSWWKGEKHWFYTREEFSANFYIHKDISKLLCSS